MELGVDGGDGVVRLLFAPLPPVSVVPTRGYVDCVDKRGVDKGELPVTGASLPCAGESGEDRLLGVVDELVDILLPVLLLL